VRAIFINRFYWPDEPATAQLLTDLAETLATRGQSVIVITSHSGSAKLPTEETHRSVQIFRVRSTRWATRLGVVGKAVDFGTFFLGALVKLFVTARRTDAVIALTDPPLLGIGVWLVSTLRGARLFHWVQDIYPEIAMELSGHRWLAAFRPLRNLAWRRATRCITLGADMAGVLMEAGVPSDHITVIPNWAPAGTKPPPSDAAADLRAQWELTGKFIVAYSGNLGRVHDLGPVLNVASALRHDTHIAFVFIGHGAQRDALTAEARSLGLTNIQFRPPQPRSSLAATLALADLHLVTVRPGCERFVFPSKLAGISAIGRPVLFIGPRDCELTRLVTQSGAAFGYAFVGTETSAIADRVRTLAQNPVAHAILASASLRYSKSIGDAEIAAGRWLPLLTESALAASVVPSITKPR
jgi:hypothetical protein